MTILGLSILPPLAIGRLGSSPEPLENYNLVLPKDGLDFRTIAPAETLYIDAETGAVAAARTPRSIQFRDGDKIRPVAPFLEVFAHIDDGGFQPLTLDLLVADGLNEADVQWTVEVGNIKAFRRTGDPKDKALATVTFSDHAIHELNAVAGHFLPGHVLPLGSVRYIRPNASFPEIRLRFTPAKGLVYGASEYRIEIDEFGNKTKVRDEIVTDRVIYNGESPDQKWLGWIDSGDATTTNPGQIYAGYVEGGNQVSWGYLDDECDGLVTVSLTLKSGKVLSAFARIGAGPPAFAPDSLPVRTVHDELVQVLLGREVQPAQISSADAEDIVRRAADTVRLMNTAVMNGNNVGGRGATASMMPSQDANDTHRAFAPVMAEVLVDNRSVLALHQAILGALRSGTAPWFVDVLRQPEEIGDLSDAGRRKMPAMMRGADGRYLTLTRRQIDMIAKVATTRPFETGTAGQAARPLNLTAREDQLVYRGRGNPPVAHPSSAISNCFPGLEFDFRNIWRRIFKGIVLTEHSNYVANIEDPAYGDLKHRRLLAIDGNPVMAQAAGPFIPGRGNTQVLPVDGNLQAVAFMEWSNTFALIRDKQGKSVSCIFTQDPSETEILWTPNDGASVKTTTRTLEVHEIFDVVVTDQNRIERSVLARALAEPGELTQGLCSPWQNDYRECACYYWAASRPDYVNVEPTENGTSRGAMWLQKDRDADYVLDDRTDVRLYTYDDLFRAWEQVLRFEIRGHDAAGTEPTPSEPTT